MQQPTTIPPEVPMPSQPSREIEPSPGPFPEIAPSTPEPGIPAPSTQPDIIPDPGQPEITPPD